MPLMYRWATEPQVDCMAACGDWRGPTNLGPAEATFLTTELSVMSWLVVLFASIGAALILGALTFVSTLIGVLVTAMIILMCGPLIDRFLARRNRRSA
jgi:hypothetical protein